MSHESAYLHGLPVEDGAIYIAHESEYCPVVIVTMENHEDVQVWIYDTETKVSELETLVDLMTDGWYGLEPWCPDYIVPVYRFKRWTELPLPKGFYFIDGVPKDDRTIYFLLHGYDPETDASDSEIQ